MNIFWICPNVYYLGLFATGTVGLPSYLVISNTYSSSGKQLQNSPGWRSCYATNVRLKFKVVVRFLRQCDGLCWTSALGLHSRARFTIGTCQSAEVVWPSHASASSNVTRQGPSTRPLPGPVAGQPLADYMRKSSHLSKSIWKCASSASISCKPYMWSHTILRLTSIINVDGRRNAPLHAAPLKLHGVILNASHPGRRRYVPHAWTGCLPLSFTIKICPHRLSSMKRQTSMLAFAMENQNGIQL